MAIRLGSKSIRNLSDQTVNRVLQILNDGALRLRPGQPQGLRSTIVRFNQELAAHIGVRLMEQDAPDSPNQDLSLEGALGIRSRRQGRFMRDDLFSALQKSPIFKFRVERGKTPRIRFVYGTKDLVRKMASNTANLDWIEGKRGDRKDGGKPWLVAVLDGVTNVDYTPVEVEKDELDRSRSKISIQIQKEGITYQIRPIDIIAKFINDNPNIIQQLRNSFRRELATKLPAAIKATAK